MSSDWPLVRLGDIISIKHGFAFKGEFFSDTATNNVLVTPGNFAIGGGFKDEKLKYYDGPIPIEYKLKAGDLVVTMTDLSKLADTLGYSALIPEHPERLYLHNQRIGLVDITSQDLDVFYLYFLMRSREYRHHVVSSATGSTVKHTSPSKITSFEFRLPPLEIQKSIGQALMRLEEKTANNQQINQTLEQMAQAIFKSWFVDFEPVKAKMAALEAGGSEDDALLAAMQAIAGSALFATDAADADAQTQLARLQAEHPEQYATLRATAELFPAAMQDSELGEIPEGWTSSNLGEFCDFQNGNAFKGKDWVDSGFPVVKIGSIKPGFVDLSKVSFVSPETVVGLERFELRAGDILVGMTGYPGETGLVPNYPSKIFLNQRVGRFIPCETYFYSYVYASVRSSEFKCFVESQAHGSAQANVSGKAILQYPLVAACQELMRLFNGIVGPMIQQMISLNFESSQLEQIRDSLLPKLLSGELSVSDAAGQIPKAEEAVNVQS